MRKPESSEIATLGWFAIILVVLFKCWDLAVAFVGLVLGAIVPLVLGAAIAYVITIPTLFFERHFFPERSTALLDAIRKPLCLAFTVLLVFAILVFFTSMLIPALVETVTMVQTNWLSFVEGLLQYAVLQPVSGVVHDFITGDFVQSLLGLDMGGLVSGIFGGTFGSVSTQLFGVMSTVMTVFFGILFSFILLTDTNDVAYKALNVLAEYLGAQRMERLALVLGVADATFHNFLVRQCIEASILGVVGTVSLLVMRFPYALGVGSLLGIAALVPIVGYPIGLCAGAFMVAIYNVWMALAYVLVVAVAQALEATFLLPHVGDPRTALPPVWVTVAVTIGGGVSGFLGMLLAIPIAATIRQLVLIGARRRANEREQVNAARTEG